MARAWFAGAAAKVGSPLICKPAMAMGLSVPAGVGLLPCWAELFPNPPKLWLSCCTPACRAASANIASGTKEAALCGATPVAGAEALLVTVMVPLF